MGVRRREQKRTRLSHVKMIVKSLAKRLKSESEISRMVSTDRILPLGSLRRECVRSLFKGWIIKLVGTGRTLTKKLSQQVLLRLRKKFNLSELGPEELKEEMTRLHSLLKASRKQKLGKEEGFKKKPKKKRAMSAMDNLETQPLLDPTSDEPRWIINEEDCIFFGVSVEYEPLKSYT